MRSRSHRPPHSVAYELHTVAQSVGTLGSDDQLASMRQSDSSQRIECPACGGWLKIVAALTDPTSVRRYLEGVGLPSRAPPVAPAALGEQLELDDAA